MLDLKQAPFEIATCLKGEWIVVASEQDFLKQSSLQTCVDGQMLTVTCEPTAEGRVYQASFDAAVGFAPNILTQAAYGFIWICVDEPKKALFELSEYAVPEARRVPCGAYGVRTSPLRAIENFLDMAHFPYIHTGILGQEPETAVKPYQVNWHENVDEIWATECFFTQPLAAPSSSRPQETEYIYRVVSPLNAILYKVNDDAKGVIPADVICLFIQPLAEMHIRAHLLMILDDQVSSMTDMVLFQQKIFTQDKPILENHVPLKLPLEKMEIPTKADALATAYRKWLMAKNWRYGVHHNEPREHANA